MQAEQSILVRIQKRQLKWYENLLRMDDQRKFISGHHMVGGEEEDSNNHEEPSDGLNEKQKHGRSYGRR